MQLDSPASAAWLRERDVDLLVVEELNVAHEFRALVVARIHGLLPNALLAGSVFRARLNVVGVGPGAGETDIYFEVVRPDGHRHILLIEDKVAAMLQPDQMLRYRQRAEALRSENTSAHVLVLAPKGYGTVAGADGQLAYEDVEEYFRARAEREEGELRDRLLERARLLNVAVQRAAQGYQQQVDPHTTTFWEQYAALALQVSPRLVLNLGGRAAGSTHMRFTKALPPAPGLPSVTAVHKLRGVVDIEVRGMAARQRDVASALGPLPAGLSVDRASKSLVLRHRVRSIDHTREFSEVQPAVLEALEAMRDLIAWWDREGARRVAAALDGKSGMERDRGAALLRRLNALLPFVGAFDSPDSAGIWHEPDRNEDGDLVLRGWAYSDELIRFAEMCYAAGWVRQRDWSPWQAEAAGLQADPSLFEHATAAQLSRFLTVVMRWDHFDNDALGHAVRMGAIAALLRRVRALALSASA